MTPELAYFLKINVGIALFYAFYRLFLYKDTFFHWRRTALLCFFGVSLLYPMLNLQEWVKAHEPMVAMADLYATTLLPEIVFDEVTITAGINWQDITLTSLKAIYLCGVILFSIRFIVQLISIIRLRIRCKAIQIKGVRVYALNKASGPFSFFSLDLHSSGITYGRRIGRSTGTRTYPCPANTLGGRSIRRMDVHRLLVQSFCLAHETRNTKQSGIHGRPACITNRI